MNKHLFLLFAIILFQSCAAYRLRPIVSSQDSTTVIKTEVKEIVRDSIIYIELPAQEKYVVRRDSSTLKIDVAQSTAFIDSAGFLHHSLKSSDYVPAVKIPIKDRLETKTSQSVIKVVEQIQVKAPPSKWDQAMIYLGYIFIGLLTGFILFMLSRIIFKIYTGR